MRIMRISDFQSKEVINVIDGKRLGHICDLEVDLHHGRIDAIVIPGSQKFLGLFGSSSDLIIPWHNVIKIGSDVVLVEVHEVVRNSAEDFGQRNYLEKMDRRLFE